MIYVATALLVVVLLAVTPPSNRFSHAAGVDTDSCATLTGDPWGLQFGIPNSVKFQKMDAARAIDQCRQEVSENPESAELAYYLGRSLYAAKDHASAELYLSQAANAGIASADIMLGIGKSSGDLPNEDASAAYKHFRRAQNGGHILGDFFVVRFLAKKSSKERRNPEHERSTVAAITDQELEGVRKAGEAGFAAAWYLLSQQDKSDPRGLKELGHLLKAEALGDIRATRRLANLYEYSMIGGDYTGPEDRKTVLLRTLLEHPERTRKMIALYEKHIALSTNEYRVNHSIARLAALYIFLDDTEFGNPERAKFLICEKLSDHEMLRRLGPRKEDRPDCS